MSYCLIVKNTFYTVEFVEDQPKRSQSAPPRLFWLVSATPVKPSRRQAARQRKREKRDEEKQVWDEYAAATRMERWSYFVSKAMASATNARMALTRSNRALTSSPSQDEMRLRLELPRALFCELAALVFDRSEDVMFLVNLGVLRIGHGGGEVQIWSSEATIEHSVIKTLLGTGRSLSAMAQDGMFQICVGGSRRGPVLRYTHRLKVEDLRLLLLLQGFPAETYRLIHLRRTLGNGFLRQYDVGPGACILLQEVATVQI